MYKNIEDRKAAWRRWYSRNKKSVIKHMNKYLEDNPEKRLLKSAKWNAKNQGLECLISEEDIIIPRRCPLLDIKLTNKRGRGHIMTNPSIDRIDPSKGYIQDNIWVISRMANHMKQNASLKQLKIFSKNILKHFS